MVRPKLSSCQFQRDVQKHLLPKKGLYYGRGNTRISDGGCGTTHEFVDRFIYADIHADRTFWQFCHKFPFSAYLVPFLTEESQ